MDEVFRALADPHRRLILDRLHGTGGLSLGQLCEGLAMSRQAVSKHLAVLEAANLVTAVKRGRERLHDLNPAPIGEITDRWIGKYDRARVEALADLKRALESRAEERPMETPSSRPGFRHVSYIRATPEAVWDALTQEAFTRRYWFGHAVRCTWQAGAPFALIGAEGRVDCEGEVIAAERPHRLAYTWRHVADPDLAAEPPSRVEITLVPKGGMVMLTVEHSGFPPGSRVLDSISEGWPAVVSSLKSLLETGEPLGNAASNCVA